MAITDMKGTVATTTGMVNQKPMTPNVPDMSKIKMPTKKQVAAPQKTARTVAQTKPVTADLAKKIQGLTNEDIACSNYIFKIPVNKNFQSINLSHSVILVCFEIFKILKTSYFKKDKKLTDIIDKNKLNTFVNFIENRLEKKGFFSPNEKKKIINRYYFT